MKKLWTVSALVPLMMALALLAATAVAQGVTVFTGSVTIDGAPAPAETTVNVTLQSSGAVIGTGTTGGAGFAVNQYRIDIQATGALEGQTVNLVVPGTLQATQATAVFNANVVRAVNIVAVEFIVVVDCFPFPVATALAPLINSGHLVLASSFKYDTAVYQAFVPGLPGNVLTEIRAHSVLFITLTQAHTVLVSGVSFPIRANTPTPVPVGCLATITLQ